MAAIEDALVLFVAMTGAVAIGLAIYFWAIDPKIRPVGATGG